MNRSRPPPPYNALLNRNSSSLYNPPSARFPPASSKTGYNLAHALRNIYPKTSGVLAGSTATSAERDQLNSTSNEPPRVHVTKGLKRLSFDALQALSSLDPEVERHLVTARNYTEDASVFAPVPKVGPAHCALARDISIQDARDLLEAGIIELVDRPSEVTGRVVVFSLPEPHKNRKRCIQHSDLINAHLPALPDSQVSFRSIPDRLQMVHNGSHIACIDFKSYYHQIPVSKEVGNRLCFFVPTPVGSRLARLKVVATGDSHVVFVAVACTKKLLSFQQCANDMDDHIDNIAVIGDSVEAVASDIATIRDRANSVNITINEDVSAPEKLVTTEAD